MNKRQRKKAFKKKFGYNPNMLMWALNGYWEEKMREFFKKEAGEKNDGRK